MKILSLIEAALSLVSITLGSCNSNPVISIIRGAASYTPTDSARAYFLPDAMDFAVDFLFQSNSPDTSRILPPDSIVNRYLFPLARLYDERRQMPILDTLIVQRQVHRHTIASTSLSIKADTTYPWVQNVMKNIKPTGNVIVDSLVRLYDLKFNYVSFPSYHPAFIWFDTYQDPLNDFALGKALLSVPGIVATTPNRMTHFFTDLQVAADASETTIRLYVGYGDCFAGCFGYDCWTFTVDNNLRVAYRGYVHQ